MFFPLPLASQSFHPQNMASLNPYAPVYIPSPHLCPVESYYSPPPLPLLYLQYNQSPCQLYTSSPSSTRDLWYYLPLQTSYTSPCYGKEFSCFQIPQPSPPRPLPLPLPLPPSALQQPSASLTLLSNEGEGKDDKPQQDHVATVGQATQGVEEKVVTKKVYTGVKGFRGFASSTSSRGKRVAHVPQPSRCQRWFPPLLRRRKLTGNYEFKKVEPDAGERSSTDAKTTVMIKNLPNKFSVEKLLDILDKHCFQENEKVLSLKGEEKASDGGGSLEKLLDVKLDKHCFQEKEKVLSLKGEEKASDGVVMKSGDGEGATAALSEFDFLYLPIDFRSGSNLGYAFVNFTSSAAAWRLHNHLHRYEWKSFGSSKICEVTYARIQELKKHFANSVFLCDRDQYLPMSFQPSRNGCNQPKPEYVGRRIHVASKVKG